VFGKLLKYFCHVSGRLPLAEDNFRHSNPQRTVMIDFGKSQILERHMPQPLDSLVRRKFSFSHLLKKFANGLSVHRFEVFS
jgi:hypothetical protein